MKIHRVLIDDSGVSPQGNKIKIFLDYRLNDKEADFLFDSVEKIQLEIALNNSLENPKDTVDLGCFYSNRLIEIEFMKDGSEKVLQEFEIPPDVQYSLFRHFLSVDKKVFPEYYPYGTEHDKL